MKTITTVILFTILFLPALYFYVVHDRDIKVIEAAIMIMLFISLTSDYIIKEIKK